MNETRFVQQLAYGLAFLGLCSAVILIRLLPLSGPLQAFPPPDMVFALIFAWVLRRPDLLPMGLIVFVVLACDMLLMRPPGLWTALVVLGSEFLRRRQKRFRSMSFASEIGLFAAMITGMIGAYWLVLVLTFADQPGLGALLLNMPITVAIYPLIVLLCSSVLGLRRRTVDDGFDRAMRR